MLCSLTFALLAGCERQKAVLLFLPQGCLLALTLILRCRVSLASY